MSDSRTDTDDVQYPDPNNPNAPLPGVPYPGQPFPQPDADNEVDQDDQVNY